MSWGSVVRSRATRLLVAIGILLGSLFMATPAPAAAAGQRYHVACATTGNAYVYPGRYGGGAFRFEGSGKCRVSNASRYLATWPIRVYAVADLRTVACHGDAPATALQTYVSSPSVSSADGQGGWIESWEAPKTRLGSTAIVTFGPDNKPAGAGILISRIFGRCPGSPEARLDWTNDIVTTSCSTYRGC